ncbi:DUF4041 domain-containing protein [Rhodococcus wratislaviensis]|uniref:Bacteriophage T5 Orf172 DNA-binding domain-containing protein n=1 Tax=Rhodococcus wratislaviensis NBRC 100605 TaxID=1219028 RepID=X0QF04_RHOWR|nr:DUF4041 domain-containing protein [Rhodococcus wratislaviensis]GAF50157.1 hypothetical protein RW1_094_01970 [Rhodococcus wratislaviensis NBRC 100605]
MTTPIPPGWHPDPQGQPHLRWWDGSRWTSATQPFAGTENPVPRTPASGTADIVQAQRPLSVFNAKKRAQELQTEVDRLQLLVDRMGLAGVSALDAESTRLSAEVARLQHEKVDLDQQITAARGALIEAQVQQELQSVGLYRYQHPAETSVQLKDELLRVQSAIKQAVKDKTAITATTNFTFNNSAAQGRRFVSDMSRMMLRAYNAEAENCVKTVKAGNLPVASQRLFKAADQISKQGQMISLRVTDHYHRLRLTELELAADFHMKVQEEKEAERERREELREQRKAEQELQAERAKLEKELAHYRNALTALEASGDTAGAQRLRDKLGDVQHALDNVDYRAANIRAGFVYVISNMGAFGINTVKIGMTRRLEPMDRVRELGDASVPFRFDVHALFFADDAVTVEAKLHQAFADRRVNKVNTRREFFYASPAEVLTVLQREIGEVISFTEEPEADEYLISIGKKDVSL